MSPKKIALFVFLAITAVVVVVVGKGTFGYNNLQNYQVWQGVSGGVDVITSPGYYNRAFGTVWTYPKSFQKFWSASAKEGTSDDESIRVTFNDAGTAKVSAFAQINLPNLKDDRVRLHEKTGGNLEFVSNLVHAHLANCIKVSGPLMSASENQASRKAEFNQVVEDQLRHGLFLMKRVRVKLPDRVDDKGNPVFVDATEIITDEKGVPVRAERSPLEEYKIEIVQFSITGTDYDELTLRQFTAKQTSYLAAQQSIAEREQEIQKKLMVVAQGERQAAEIEAAANQVKKKATVEAQQKVEVALKDKETAETAAQQTLSVAKIEKERAQTLAEQEKEVARISAERDAAVATVAANRDASVKTIAADAVFKASTALAAAKGKEAEGIVAIAQAKQKEIELGGAIKDYDRVLAEIHRDRDVKVAEALSRIPVPQTIIQGGGGGAGGGENMQGFLLSLTLLKNLGVLEPGASIQAPQIQQPKK